MGCVMYNVFVDGSNGDILSLGMVCRTFLVIKGRFTECLMQHMCVSYTCVCVRF